MHTLRTSASGIRLLMVLALWPASVHTAFGQRARRANTTEDTGPVEVTRSATLRITIATDTAGLFEYLSDPKKLEDWFPDKAVFEPMLTGKYHFVFSDREGVWSGIVTDFIRGNTLGYTWKSPDDDYETNVKFKLTLTGNQTLLDLTHSGFLTNAAMDKAVKDWTFYLANLKSVIEGGNDQRQQRKAAHKRPRG